MKRGVVGRGSVHVELHMDAARPYEDDIPTDGIVKWCHDDVCIVGLAGLAMKRKQSIDFTRYWQRHRANLTLYLFL